MRSKFVVLKEHIRTIQNPTLPDAKVHFVLVNVKHLPKDLSLGPDPRVPKVTSPVFKKIAQSLLSWDGRFHLLNRGITISAKICQYDNKSQMLEMDIPEEDDKYGIIDGGHTYKSIVNSLESEISEEGFDQDQYVRLEVMTGIEDQLMDIAEARNYSIQVKKYSLENKRGSFDWIIKALEDKKSLVKFSENDDEPVHVTDIIQLLTCLNLKKFDDNNHPVEAYKNSGKCLEWFLDPEDKFGFQKMAPIVLKTCELYDYIRYRWVEIYNQPDDHDKRGKFGRTTEANLRKRNRKSAATYHFIDKNGKYPIEKGLAFPLLAGFRALVKSIDNNNDNYSWQIDPIDFFDNHGKRLISTIAKISDNRDNDPHLVGRDESSYSAIYNEVRRWWLEDEILKSKQVEPTA